MKAVPGFEIINIEDDYMAIPVGANIASFNGTVVLNEVSAFLLEKLKSNCTKEDLVQFILEVYDIDLETAKRDVNLAIAKMLKIGLVEE